MNISTDIKIVKSWLEYTEALLLKTPNTETNTTWEAVKNVIAYAEKCYKKEYAKDTMEQLTKILTGEKDEDIKKH